ncbi:MAG: hypothetical protein U0132_04540 [Gemmatimonadaceae bacterium]
MKTSSRRSTLRCRALSRLATLGVLLLLACTDSAAPTPKLLVLCSSQVQLTVGKRLPPTFAWTPACGATYLEVTSPDRGTVYWIVKADTGRFPPPVRYGVTPPGMVLDFGPMPLTNGQMYLVRLGLIVDENSFATIGEQLFAY